MASPGTKRRILVLGEDTQSFLAVIRSLGRAGFEVHAAWCPLDSAALTSRYLHAIHRIPPFRSGGTDWISAFKELFEREHFDLVLPTTDSSILPFQLHRAIFEPLIRIHLLPDDVYQTCINKDKTWELAKKLAVPVPGQVIVENTAQASEAARLFGYPLVLKPQASTHKQNPLEHRQVRKVRSETELLHAAAEMTASQPVLAQENVIGIGAGVEVLCKDGRVLLAFQHERVHEPIQGGGSSYRKSVPLDEAMLAATTKLMEMLKYTGVAMVEFKQDRASGRWVLLEINARFWGSLALCHISGMDFPLALVRLLLDGQESFPRQYRTGMYCRHWSRDFDWFLANLNANKSDPTLQTRKISSVLLEASNFLALREGSDTFAIDDPMPAWQDIKLFSIEKLFRVFKLSRLLRWYHHLRLARRYRETSRFLVMCHGNICRSPFAAAALDRYAGMPSVSRGIYPVPGRSAPENAVAAAREKGIDLSAHSSAVITPEEIRSADLLLIFDRKNWLNLRGIAPDCMDRVAYVGAADPTQPLEIDDPYGKDIQAFRDCYARIEKSLALLRALD